MSHAVKDLIMAARLPRTLRRRPQLKLALLALAEHCSDDGTNARASVATLAADSEVSIRTMDGLLERLTAATLIEQQEPPRQQQPRTYRVILTAVIQIGQVSPTVVQKLISREGHRKLRLSDRQHVAGLNQYPDRQDQATRPAGSGGQTGKSAVSDICTDPVIQKEPGEPLGRWLSKDVFCVCMPTCGNPVSHAARIATA